MLNILLVPNPQRDLDLKETRNVAAILSSFGVCLACTETFSDIPQMAPEEGAQWADLAIVLGGDGTILRFSHAAASCNLPILGINCGNLGYMAEANASLASELKLLVSGDYSVEERMMISATVLRNGQEVIHADCLNDAVVCYGKVPHLVSFSLSESGRAVASYNADGLIFSTPTGSTAYSLSAGGPILDPVLEAIAVTPVCAHSLTARPMVFSASAQLSLTVCSQKKGEAYLTLDGGQNVQLFLGDQVLISRSLQKTRLIRFSSTPFVNVLAAKLNNNK